MGINNIIKFKEICDKLEIKIDTPDSFKKRFVVQKIFYFLKKLGINLETQYNFFTYGPYSSNISDYYDTILSLSDQELITLPKEEINRNEELILEKARDLFSKWGKDIKLLEFYSCVLFIYEDMYIKQKNIEKLKTIFKKLKPNLFDEIKFEKVLNDLRIEGFIHK